MKRYRVNPANTSHKELREIAEISGLDFFEGNRHTKVKTKTGEFVTEIPRHNPLNKWTAKGIIKDLVAHGAFIDLV